MPAMARRCTCCHAKALALHRRLFTGVLLADWCALYKLACGCNLTSTALHKAGILDCKALIQSCVCHIIAISTQISPVFLSYTLRHCLLDPLMVLKDMTAESTLDAGDRLIARGLLKRTQLKAGLLTAPKEHWPPFEGGLSMEVDGVTSDGRQMFRYLPSASYNVSLHVPLKFIVCMACIGPHNTQLSCHITCVRASHWCILRSTRQKQKLKEMHVASSRQWPLYTVVPKTQAERHACCRLSRCYLSRAKPALIPTPSWLSCRSILTMWMLFLPCMSSTGVLPASSATLSATLSCLPAACTASCAL